MCFSAPASFGVAAVTLAIGVAALSRAQHWQEVPLAAVPLLFAAQQAIEGFLWSLLPNAGNKPAVGALVVAFLIFAKVVWPAVVPAALFLVETDPIRRRALSLTAVLGAVVAGYLLVGLIGSPPAASIRGTSIQYTGYQDPFSWQVVLYILCTCIPLFLSSHRWIVSFGAVISVGFVVSSYLYAATLVSVWCFFAAAGSVLLYFHFGRLERAQQSKKESV